MDNPKTQHWTHRTQDEDNPETVATLDTQNTGRRQPKDTQHWTHRTEDEDKQNAKTQHNTEN
jgi:hypothetical protein